MFHAFRITETFDYLRENQVNTNSDFEFIIY